MTYLDSYFFLHKGTSAGGIANFYYADILKNMLPAETKYWVAADRYFNLKKTNNF